MILHARAGPPQARVDILDGMLAFQRQMPSTAASPSARANVLRSRSRPENQTSGRTWRRSGMRGLTECALRRARFERHIEHIHRLVRQILGLVLQTSQFFSCREGFSRSIWNKEPRMDTDKRGSSVCIRVHPWFTSSWVAGHARARFFVVNNPGSYQICEICVICGFLFSRSHPQNSSAAADTDCL